MDKLNNLDNVLVIQTEGARIGQHQTSKRIVTFSLKQFNINVATCIRREWFDLKAAHGRSGGVGPMR